MLKKLILKSIRFYQKWFSLDQGFLGNIFHLKVCRFQPYCSEYSYQAIEKYGIIKGSFMGIYRILRCNPFSKGGLDPVQ